jgi:hypothetical protein
MTVRSPNERDLVERQLARVWQEFTPAPNLQQQVRARLTSSTAATMGAVGMGVASQARPEGAWASLQATGKLGVLVGAGLMGFGALSGYLVRDSQQEAAPPAAMVQRMEASGDERARAGAEAAATSERPPQEDGHDERVRSGALATPRTEAAARAPRARPSRAQSHTLGNEPPLTVAPTRAANAAGNLSDELLLLQRAERAVRAHNPALALALIGELEERYPRSIVLEERRAIELMAHCVAGATDASARAQRFLRDHPRSVHAGRIGEVCPSEIRAPTPRRSQTSGTPDTESVKESP